VERKSVVDMHIRDHSHSIPGILTVVGSLTFWTVSIAMGQWSISPGTNTRVCASPGDQTVPSIVSDGSGGAIIAWNDTRTLPGAVYVQRLSSSGVSMWTENGRPLRIQQQSQASVKLVSDGRGGAIAVWIDSRSADTALMCQRVDGNGTTRWNGDGVQIAYVRSNGAFHAVADNVNGLILAWEDRRAGYSGISAQRISQDGQPLWGSGGVPVSSDSGLQSGPMVIADGTGGALCTWTDSRAGGIYLQRLNGIGVTQWQTGGIAVGPATAGRIVNSPVIATDGAFGAVLSYFSRVASGPRLILAQRFDPSGKTMWVDTLDQQDEMSQGGIRTVSSGSVVTTLTVYAHGGVFHYGIVSCVDTSGAILWQQGPFADESDIVDVVADNAHGVFVLGSVALTGEPFRFSVQHITGSGNPTWVNGGVSIDSTSALTLPANPAVVIDGVGGLIIVWQQDGGGAIDLFAQHVDVNGNLPGPPNVLAAAASTYSLSQNFPNPFNPSTTIRFGLPESAEVSLIVYNSLGQRVTTLVQQAQEAGYHEVKFDASVLASGMYYYRLQAGAFVQTKKLLVLH
jgi:rhodanese-related sulfurtransferase